MLLEVGLVAVALVALIIASVAGGLHAPALWILATVLGAGYLLARGASRGLWLGRASLSGPRTTAEEVGAAASGGNAMTVSEERLSVDKRKRARERVRLRRYVVTEQVTVTVPVRREHLRLVREPIQADESDLSVVKLGGPASGYEVTLYEETVVVDKQVVPRERVKVSKEVVTEQEQISELVRREEVDIEHDEPPGRDASPTTGKDGE